MSECIYEKVSRSSDIATNELQSICLKYRSEISKDEWDRFASTFVVKSIQEHNDKQTLMRLADCFAISLCCDLESTCDAESTQSSVCAVMNMPFEENTQDMDSGEDSWGSCSDIFESSLQCLSSDDERSIFPKVNFKKGVRLESVNGQRSWTDNSMSFCLKDINDSSTEHEVTTEFR